MSSLTYKSFVVAGTGALGSAIASELAKQGANVVFFTRGGNSATPEGIPTKVVNYTDADAVAEALQGTEVVVSTLSGAGFAVQPTLADAAKKAGVKLFVPSEFGSRTQDLPAENPLAFKAQFQQYLKSIGLPYTIYNVGLFADVPLNAFPGVLDIPAKKLTIVGKGETKISLATRPDIGHFVAYTLTHLPASRLENGILGLEGSKLTFKEIATVWEKKYGGKFEIEHRDPDAVLQEVKAKGPAGILDYILWVFEQGYANVTDDSALVPGWKPLSYDEAVAKYYPDA
ncbi:NAD(P)-binding protein [Auricularia subglabra TFB-10046 SS5]|uniref:NAD(P)-binding protein n=1 Tax=Auricularia subglabra (strain TFB-10046 / SS5) TaxID=717982 RepID=J0LJF7_AURST|nr:NAD(P)-binding protein [Auricularia subglabra TFB-10046 SS5]